MSVERSQPEDGVKIITMAERKAAILELPFKEVLTIQEAAQIIKCDPFTVKYLIERERLAAVKRGKNWWLNPAEVNSYQRSSRGPRLKQV